MLKGILHGECGRRAEEEVEEAGEDGTCFLHERCMTDVENSDLDIEGMKVGDTHKHS
jgi:hypothetical protein